MPEVLVSTRPDAIGGAGVAGAIATLLGPNFLKAADTVARDARVIGTEFIYSQTKEPFFRRLALLPDADEGLQGALRDRNNLFTREAPKNMFARGLDAVGTGARTATKEVFPNDIPFRTTQQGQAIGKAKPVSKATKGVADFMDKTGFADTQRLLVGLVKMLWLLQVYPRVLVSLLLLRTSGSFQEP